MTDIQSHLKRCSIQGCGNPHIAKGFCSTHYSRFKKHGNPLGGRATARGELLRFFKEVVMPYEGVDCLVWPYARCSNGYGRVWKDDRLQGVHRLVCEETHGPPPTAQHEAAHSCGKGHEGCVTKGHLSWKTPKENQADKFSHNTHNRGERHPMAKLTEPDVREIRSLQGKERQHVTAKRFGVSRNSVSNIQNGRTWLWLQEGTV
jgi:hypothetical protein